MHTRLRRILITTASVVLITTATLTTLAASGCSKQAVTAALIAEVGVDVQAALTIQGVDPTTSATINGLFQIASTDIGKWVPGSDSSEAQQALKDATDALGQILPNSQAKAYIDLALGTAENIITLIQSQSPANPAPAVGLTAAHNRHGVTATARVVTLPHPPTTAAEFRKQWGAIGGGVALPKH